MNVFGIYGILGRVVVKEILQLQETPFQTVETIGHFFSFLGFPFLMLAWYMFIRLCREMVEKKLSRTFNLSFFLALTLIFIVYGAFIVNFNLSDVGEEQYAFLSSSIPLLYAASEAIVLVIAILQLFLYGKKTRDEKNQKAIQIFAFMNLFAFGAIILLCLYTERSTMLAAIFLLVFFSRNLLPVLYWRSHLKKHFIAPILHKAGSQTMRQFSQEHGISKREEEVIQQLCEGKTNKEISDALFISLQTVKDHIYRIYQKTDVKNRVQLINLIQSCKEEGENGP
jgi:DNA-binding CsgD family transcriptional regulator/uncharacterized protein with PQ loop repeat